MTKQEIEQELLDMLLFQPNGWKPDYWCIPNESIEVIVRDHTSNNFYTLHIKGSKPTILDGWYMPDKGIETIQLIIRNQLDKLYQR